MEPTNGRYNAGFTDAEVVNLKDDVKEIKANVQKLVDKLWRLETRVYIVAAILALAVAKGSSILEFMFK